MKTMKKTVFFAAIFTFVSLLSSSFGWADSYTHKTQHDSGDPNYKHKQRSFTSPFDYAPCVDRPVREIKAPVPANRCNQFTFDATKSYDLDKQKLSVLWDFGDGTTSTEPVVTHTYEKAGDYMVLLTVKDNSGLACDSNLATTKVKANYPPIVSAGENQKACVGESVKFDASKTQMSAPGTYRWDFGDGTTGEGKYASHIYEKPGQYRVALTVDDGLATTCSTGAGSTLVSVGDRPAVSLQGPASTCTGRPATFTAAGTGGALKYRWDFGDGATVEGGPSMTHVYQKGGTYNVSVVADNGQGYTCSVAMDSLKIKVNSSPIADAGTNLVCCVDKESFFDASKSFDADYDVLTYRWDFGDGESGEGAKTTHVYKKNGSYRVVLTVKDSSGDECGVSTSSFVANVNVRPEAVIEVR